MTSNNFSKFNVIIFYIFSVQKIAESTTNFGSDNTVSTNEGSQQNLYSRLPQVYVVPYRKYIPSLNLKYVVSQRESQTPIAVSSTEKALLSSGNKVTLDTSNYVTSQVVRPPQGAYSRYSHCNRYSQKFLTKFGCSTSAGNQANYPYLYTIAKVRSSAAATSNAISSAVTDNHENTPKKYHYGYRVSNPHTGAEFGHSEVSDGHSARGYYHVLLPDGRLQNVKYWAGPSGYHATITYETQY